ncbi:2OG-Fe dioxygenase family protein [Glaciimonas immobilis]|uniref:BsmA domain containing protein n=1 Tax=Glaciimonas immobilis TaxID=728004 RepID=A0A840S1X5_9BURK|nr:2OG-Fe dioxygenase family protein [Glaciimonas immobilis]MBB5202681.1 hypothetical protein [Glaciimonas immobilis]
MVSEEVKASFGNLVFDQYMGNGNRYRRFSQYKLYFAENRWQFELLPHRPYMTFSKYNKVAGGIQRIYEPLQVDFTPQVEAMALGFPLQTHDDWQINVHQYRVHTRPDLAGVTVPEGAHQDGHDFVGIAVVTRVGITGAEMTLLPLGGKSEPFYRGTVQEGEVALLNDRKMFHYVNEIVAIDEVGYRDIFVVAFSRWADRWHGKEFESRVVASAIETLQSDAI